MRPTSILLRCSWSRQVRPRTRFARGELMTFKRTTPITALDLDPTDLPEATASSRGAAKVDGTLARWRSKNWRMTLRTPRSSSAAIRHGTVRRALGSCCLESWRCTRRRGNPSTDDHRLLHRGVTTNGSNVLLSRLPKRVLRSAIVAEQSFSEVCRTRGGW